MILGSFALVPTKQRHIDKLKNGLECETRKGLITFQQAKI
jgi:hypothetical protein